jgi:uncharacterized membrane protein
MSIDLTTPETGTRFQPRPQPHFEGRERGLRESRGQRRGALSMEGTQRLSTALGWFSIGLGIAELVAPRSIANIAGLRDQPMLIRGCGLREIASGLGILTQRRRGGWMWSRVAGDVMDLALLGTSLGPHNRYRNRTAIAAASVAGITLLDAYCSQRLSRIPTARAAGLEEALPIETSITINRSPEDCYRFWRGLENLPQFMKHLESIQVLDERRSHWVARGPAGRNVHWDAEIVADTPNEYIAWRSVGPSQVSHSGSVRFQLAPAGRGTIVHVSMQYTPPGGVLGSVAARLFGREPQQQIPEDLRRFKNVMETGEIPTTAGQPSGRRSLIARAFSASKGQS